MAHLHAVNETDALEQLHQLGCTDGLPVVIPISDRVNAMVVASALDGDIELGEMGPGYGIATVEKVAVNAVMAGCTPEMMPMVVAAIRAVCNPRFDLTEMQCTTHCIAPLLLINGPAVTAGGFAAGFGLMGPGHRANLSVGRALRLAMMNIGGARPGESDMAIHGSPAKISLCFAEDELSSPWPPLHTSLGFGADESVLTVLGVEGPHSVLFSGESGDNDSALALLDVIAAVIANRGSNNAYFGGVAGVAVVLNPEHAEILANAGYSRADVQQALAARATNPRDVLERLNKKLLRGAGQDLPAVDRPENILVIVAGAPGLYTMVMPSWAAGPNGNQFVSETIELNPYCELPARA